MKLAAIALLMFGMFHSQDSPISAVSAAVTPCPYEVHTLVMRAVMKRVPGQLNSVSVQYNPSSCGQTKEEHAAINSLRVWYKANVKDRCVASAYGEWLGYWEQKLGEAETECRTHTEANRFKAWEEEERRYRQHLNEYERTHPKIPEPN